MQFETILVARLPRCQCKEHGVKTVQVPWVARHSRFKQLFESFAIELLQHCANITATARMQRFNWHAVNQIMQRDVERGLSCHDAESIEYLGIDEKRFKAGQHYVTVLNDLEEVRVLEVVEHRTTASTRQALESLNRQQKEHVKAVSFNPWKPFASAVRE